jgi:hypothetical protein
MKFSQLIIMAVIVVLTTVASASADRLLPLVDNFEHPDKNNIELTRLYFDDRSGGGNTNTKSVIENGLLRIKGDLIPARGQPAWTSVVLPLIEMNNQADASQFEGVRIRLRVIQGNLNVSANSIKISNFDYHSAPIPVYADGDFHVVNVPFKSMKRGWSAQTKLDRRTLASLSIVAFSMKKAPFEFDIDSVSFY